MALTIILRPAVWPIFALFGALGLLAGAHAFEVFGGLRPCALCLTQREVHWGATAIALTGLGLMRLRPRPALERLTCGALSLVFLLSAAVALHHVAVEQGWVIARCDEVDFSASFRLPEAGDVSTVRCDAIAWEMFGISMAGYNALASLTLAALSFWASTRDA